MEETSISIIVGALLPAVVDLVNAHIENSKYRYLVAIGSSLLVAVAINWSNLLSVDLLKSAAIVFAVAQVTYEKYWSVSAPRQRLLGMFMTKKEVNKRIQ